MRSLTRLASGQAGFSHALTGRSEGQRGKTRGAGGNHEEERIPTPKSKRIASHHRRTSSDDEVGSLVLTVFSRAIYPALPSPTTSVRGVAPFGDHKVACMVMSPTLFVATSDHTRAGDTTTNSTTSATRTGAQRREAYPLCTEIADSSSSEGTGGGVPPN